MELHGAPGSESWPEGAGLFLAVDCVIVYVNGFSGPESKVLGWMTGSVVVAPLVVAAADLPPFATKSPRPCT